MSKYYVTCYNKLLNQEGEVYEENGDLKVDGIIHGSSDPSVKQFSLKNCFEVDKYSTKMLVDAYHREDKLQLKIYRPVNNEITSHVMDILKKIFVRKSDNTLNMDKWFMDEVEIDIHGFVAEQQ
jgi:hypothetical protein